MKTTTKPRALVYCRVSTTGQDKTEIPEGSDITDLMRDIKTLSSYDVIRSDDMKELIESVTEAMKNGWQPLGGIAVTRIPYEYPPDDAPTVDPICGGPYYYQAMMRTTA